MCSSYFSSPNYTSSFSPSSLNFMFSQPLQNRKVNKKKERQREREEEREERRKELEKNRKFIRQKPPKKVYKKHIKTIFDWSTNPGPASCPALEFIYIGTLHFKKKKKLIQLSTVDRFLIMDGILCSLHFCMLGLCLVWTCADILHIVTVSVSANVYQPVVSKRYCFLAIIS